MYAKIINGIVVRFPYTEQDLRQDNRGTSFPSVISTKTLAEYGVFPVVVTSPSYDPGTQALELIGCVQKNGRLETDWRVRSLTNEEIRAKIPSVVSMRQGRLAMLGTPYASGTLLDVIEAMLNGIPDETQKRAAKIDWGYAQEIRRDFPLVQQLTSQLGLTERQIDDLFVLAATL